jgi:hypothetical protein
MRFMVFGFEFQFGSLSQELLWLRHGDSSGIQKEGERPPLEACTTELAKRDQTEKIQCCSEL